MPEPPSDLQLWQKAASFAARAHAQQIRKDNATPYYAHPARVGLLVATWGFDDPDILAAALLHDTIEDTTVDHDDLVSEFNPTVAGIVACLSKDPRLPEPQREEQYDAQLARGPWQARLIKLADVYDNLSDAVDDKSRRKTIGKVRRALDLTADDPQLASARALVGSLLESPRNIGAAVE